MANRYLHNNATGTPADPWQTYGTDHAFTLETFDAVALAAGEIIWVSDTHSETIGATKTYTASVNAVAENPQKLLCVSNIDTNTALAIGATIAATGSYGAIFEGDWYIHGCIFDLSSSNSAGSLTLGTIAGPCHITLKDCTAKIANSSTARVYLGEAASSNVDEIVISLDNFVFYARNAGNAIALRQGKIYINNLSVDAASSATPTSLFVPSTTSSVATVIDVLVENSDLTGKAFTNLVDSGVLIGRFLGRNLKLPSGVVYCTDEITTPQFEFDLVDCTQGTTHVPYYGRRYGGEIICEQTILPNSTADRMTLAGDATNYHSMKLVASAKATFVEPLYSPWINIAIADTGTAITPYAEILLSGDGATVATDRELWIEVDKMTTATYRLGTRDDDAPTLIATGTNQADGTITWTGHGYSTPRTHKVALGSSFTPAHKGYIRIRVAWARASATAYVGKVGVA